MLPGIAILMALSGMLPGGWPNYRHDLNNSGAVAGPAHVTGVLLSPAWTYMASTRITSTPTVAGGTVYVGTWLGGVLAIDETSGRVLWRKELGANSDWVYGGPRGVVGSVAIDDGVAYAASGSCFVAAFDARSGRKLWKTLICDTRKNDDIYASPVVTNGLVLIGVDMLVDRPTDRGREVALDARTGRLRWTLYPQRYAGTGAGISASPAVDKSAGIAFLGTGNPTPENNPPAGPDPGSDSIVAFNVSNGRTVWSFGPVNPHDTHDFDFFASPNRFATIVNGRSRWLIGESSKNGSYYAVDAQTGHQVWQHFVMQELIGTAAVANDTIYVTAYADTDNLGAIAALRASDGLEMWRRQAAGMYESPAVWGSVVFVSEATGWLDALSAGTGAVLGRWHLGGYLHGRGPSVADGRLFVTTDKRLICYSLSAR